MQAGKAFLYASLLAILAPCALPQQVQAGLAGGNVCIELNRLVASRASERAEVTAALAAYSSSGGRPAQEDICAGIVFSIRAAFKGVLGRIAEAELDAERSIAILEKRVAHDDRLLIRPLHTLVIARLELGKNAEAWQAYRRMKLIRAEKPEDHAMIHDVAATLLHASGRLKECELEYRASLGALNNAGQGNTANAAATLTVLAYVYIKDRQFAEARRTLDRAAAILGSAMDAVPLDRIRLLHSRGLLHYRMHQWQDSEQDLREAVAVTDREKLSEPLLVATLWSDYAAVLRKNHRRGEARSIEARAAASRRVHSGGVVDVTELLAISGAGRNLK